ncbi:hypothetical protein M407DRAFT_34527 [Tulasnella calospora MUT 4182]|uniref:Importin subunit alpha n=1 Tax=Tulasnella calospora MUT 4182 TaxID=1051891 RepID=A0A0C3Q161_9AGAM|nr:hypothetical protein M407DRAFT_34527 [Tulasnella calospora MUT 4182]
MLSSSNATLVSEASWILFNVTLGTSRQTSAVVSAGAIPRLVAVFASDVEDTTHNALLALGNIAGASDELRGAFLEQRAFRPALEILADPSKFSAKIVNAATWVMETCTAPSTTGKHNKVSTFRETLPVLCKFIQQKNESKPIATVVRALRHICYSNVVPNMIFEAGAVPHLVQFCTSKNDGLREDALSLVARFAYHEGMLLQSILDNGILQALQTCITNHVRSRQLACVVASNIAGATPLQAEALIQSSILPVLTGLVANQEEAVRVQHEAVAVLLHLATKGERNHDFFSSLLEADCVEACCAALQSTDWMLVEKSVRIIKYLIDTPWSGADDAIERLEDSGGVKLLRKVWLEHDGNHRTESATAHTLLRVYFPESSRRPKV